MPCAVSSIIDCGHASEMKIFSREGEEGKAQVENWLNSSIDERRSRRPANWRVLERFRAYDSRLFCFAAHLNFLES